MGKGAQIPNPKIQTPNKLQASNSNGGKERGQPCPRVHGKAKRVDIWCGRGRLWQTNGGRRMSTPNSNQRSTFNRGHGPWDGRACVAAPPHIWERAAARPYRKQTPRSADRRVRVFMAGQEAWASGVGGEYFGKRMGAGEWMKANSNGGMGRRDRGQSGVRESGKQPVNPCFSCHPWSKHSGRIGDGRACAAAPPILGNERQLVPTAPTLHRNTGEPCPVTGSGQNAAFRPPCELRTRRSAAP